MSAFSSISPPNRSFNPTRADSITRQRSALAVIKDIKDLLTLKKKEESPTQSREAPQQESSDEVCADFTARVGKYNVDVTARPEQTDVVQRRPHERFQIVSEDESNIRPPTGSQSASEEITLTTAHGKGRRRFNPRRKARIDELKSLNYIKYLRAMKSHVQVLTTPTADTSGTTLLLHFDNRRYFFGSLAEGTQRAGVQMGARLLKVSEYFVTGRSEWSNLGGLIGMILTLADSAASSKASMIEDLLKKARSKAQRTGLSSDEAKKLEDEALSEVKNNRLRLFGPPNFRHTLATARRFVFRKGMPVEINEVKDSLPLDEETEDGPAPYYADENIKVWAMSISPSAQSRPATSRKRSIDEVNGVDESNGDQSPVSTVVNEMFNSTWRMDTLYETPLNEVKLPAAIYIRDRRTSKVQKYSGPLPGGVTPVPDPTLKVLVRKPWPGALIESLPKTEAAKQSVSYIVRNHRQRGKFRPERAQELKVEKGKKFTDLTAGLSVLNADGETITPDMVLGPSKEGGGFAVVDLPDPSYIQPLIDRPEWFNEKLMTGVGAFIWICGKDVATDLRLHAFMQKFPDLQHLVSSPDYCPNEITLDSVAASTARLSKVDPERWSVPIHNDQARLAARYLPFNGVRPAKRGQIYRLEPKLELDDKMAPPTINFAAIEKQLSQKVLDEAAAAREASKNPSEQDLAWQHSLIDGEAEVITLGTGSALPSKYRNVSATLVRVPGWGAFLLDCGENTLGQLRRVFPEDELKQVLQELRLIFISHMHADHHLGTASVIKAWYEEVHNSQPALPVLADEDKTAAMSSQGKRLSVISEPAMMHWLAEYAAVEDYGYSRIAPLIVSAARPEKNVASSLIWFNSPSSSGASIAAKSTYDDPAGQTANIVPASALGLQDVQAVLVRHCHGARAVSITLPSGFKASYSGDCRPSRPFSQIGKGSTVCIHEATFDDELQGDAEAKNHSTTSEALGVAQAMGAKACALTHFSQRYQKIPVLERAAAEETDDLDSAVVEDAEGDDADAEMAEPLGDDIAPTLPNQNGTASNTQGQNVDLPEKRLRKSSTASSSGPAAVKFKLKSDMKVCVAFDYMRVKVRDMWKMEKFTPALLELFAEEDKALEKDGTAGKVDGGKGKKKAK